MKRYEVLYQYFLIKNFKDLEDSYYTRKYFRTLEDAENYVTKIINHINSTCVFFHSNFEGFEMKKYDDGSFIYDFNYTDHIDSYHISINEIELD